jgi:hypothetical protein
MAADVPNSVPMDIRDRQEMETAQLTLPAVSATSNEL